MIVDRLDHASAYFNLSRGIRAALEYLQRTDLAALPIGRHVVDADAVFALVSEYETEPPEARFWEAHRRHIDVQYLQSGVERIAVGTLSDFTVEHYDSDRDLVVAQGAAAQVVTVGAGGFAILFPHDVHMPGLKVGDRGRVKKIVLKVRVGER